MDLYFGIEANVSAGGFTSYCNNGNYSPPSEYKHTSTMKHLKEVSFILHAINWDSLGDYLIRTLNCTLRIVSDWMSSNTSIKVNVRSHNRK